MPITPEDQVKAAVSAADQATCTTPSAMVAAGDSSSVPPGAVRT